MDKSWLFIEPDIELNREPSIIGGIAVFFKRSAKEKNVLIGIYGTVLDGFFLKSAIFIHLSIWEEIECYTKYKQEDNIVSNINLCPSVELHVEVVVRAFKDEPVVLHAVSNQKGVVEVSGENQGRTMGFPESLVLLF